MTMFPGLTHIYEVYSVTMGIQMRVCYAELVTVERGHLRLLTPFRQVLYHADLGTIACRENIKHPLSLPVDKYDYAVLPASDWMELRYEDAVCAGLLCTEVSQPLPENGFRRLFT